MDLPYATHRCLIEPLSGKRHIKLVLIKRFISFMDKIDKSPKSALKMLKSEALKDVRSVTGTNFRGIMRLTGEMNLKKLSVHSLENLEYNYVPDEDKWKVIITKELSGIVNGDAEVEGFDKKELTHMFNSLCVS